MKEENSQTRKDATLTKFQEINPYLDIGTELHLETDGSLDEQGKNKIVIDKTQPKVSLHKWNSEVQLGITYQSKNSLASATKDITSNKVTWEHVDEIMECIPVLPSPQMEDGGMEINIILNSKPSSNVFTFQLDNWENLDFFHQAPLTDQEIKEGANRPDNVVGSYAVYYKDHANHIEGQTNYATGKAYHIFRPLVTDANGAITWADLFYTNGVLIVTVSQSFLDNAIYPIKIDPTIGNTVAGASIGAETSNRVIASAFTPTTNASGGSVTEIQFYGRRIDVGSPNIIGGIYNTSSNVLSPQSTAVSVTNNVVQWWVMTFSGPTLSGSTNYWPAIIKDASPTTRLVEAHDTGSNGDGKFGGTATYPTFPNPDSFTDTTSRYSIYATYTASASVSTTFKSRNNLRPRIFAPGNAR